jgi:ketosteroid isomerase-like protein
VIGRLLIAVTVTSTLSACAITRTPDISGEARGSTKAAIAGVLDTQVEAWNRGDLKAFMEGYWKSSDLVFTSGGRVQRGWQTTLDRYRAAYGERTETMGRLMFTDLEVHELERESAWALGRWRLETDGELRGGVFSLVFRRIDGRWLIVHDHTTESTPTP